MPPARFLGGQGKSMAGMRSNEWLCPLGLQATPDTATNGCVPGLGDEELGAELWGGVGALLQRGCLNGDGSPDFDTAWRLIVKLKTYRAIEIQHLIAKPYRQRDVCRCHHTDGLILKRRCDLLPRRGRISRYRQPIKNAYR